MKGSWGWGLSTDTLVTRDKAKERLHSVQTEADEACGT